MRRRAAFGLLAMALGALFGCARGQHAAPPTRVHEVEGLEAPVEILVDRWGIPHIYAARLYDAFFAQGWNAARDRLFQLDLWKRRGDGTLAEAFGPAFVEKDRAARLFLFRGDMRAEWLAYGSDTKRIVRAFVAGINAYIRLTQQNPDLLPFEFRQLDYAPALWTPETVVRIRSHGLLWNAESEASRAVFVRQHGLDALRFRERLEPPHAVEVPEGLDLADVPDDVLQVYELARAPVVLERGAEGELRLAAAPAPRQPAASNNWALAPSRTATGRAFLANDPHRALSLPSLRYLAHLSAPGLDVIGAGEPSLPGISIGHNRRIAFGLTLFFIDQEDLYVYATHPERPQEYLYRGRWEPMRIVREPIAVRGGPPVEVALEYTRHGPVIHRDAQRQRAVALRAAWLEPGMAPYLASLATMRAQDWDGFLSAMNRWGLPPENLVYADVDGHIGWKPGGLAPIRRGWDGLLPVPGDGRYEWAGFLDADALPVERDPERGFLATANQMDLPEGYPRPLGFEWIQPYRYRRIREVLEAEPRATLEAMARLQVDVQSIPARRVLRQLQGLDATDPSVRRALDLLRSWDGRMQADSPAAALFEIWARGPLVRVVMEAWIDDPGTLEAVLDEDALYDVFEGSSAEVWLSRLESPTAWPGPTPRATRDAALRSSLAEAVIEAEARLGPDWESWRWGRLHRVELRHPLSALLDDGLRGRVDLPPQPRPGSGDTVNSGGYRLGDFRQRWGAPFRMLVDVGAWDAAQGVSAPGESGDPGSPHYRDLFEIWGRDAYVPLLFSRKRIEAESELRILLTPRPGTPAGAPPGR